MREIFFFLNGVYMPFKFHFTRKNHPIRSVVPTVGNKTNSPHIIWFYLNGFLSKVKLNWHDSSASPLSYQPENKNKPLSAGGEQILPIQGQNGTAMGNGARLYEYPQQGARRGQKRHYIRANTEATLQCTSSITSIYTAEITVLIRCWFLGKGEKKDIQICIYNTYAYIFLKREITWGKSHLYDTCTYISVCYCYDMTNVEKEIFVN